MAGPLDPLPAMFSFKGLKCGRVLKPRGEPGNTELWGPPSPETVILQGGVQEPAFLTAFFLPWNDRFGELIIYALNHS